ncbi:Clostripain [subsurface metagenome]
MKKNYFILIFVLLLALITTGCGGGVAPPISNLPEWTVMVYLDADNNLESAGIDDINEMEMVGSSTDVNIVIQVDRIPRSVLDANNEGSDDDISNGNWTNTRRYYITQDYDPYTINSQLISELGELNMGSPQTLIDFATWAVTNYPAKKYLLVIWNHGGGFRSKGLAKDIAWDDTSGGDKITMSELEYALSAISIQMGKNIDIVGMDACLMAMTEVAYQIKDYADILVTSEESEPNDGWPYDTILGQLVSYPTMTPNQVATNIVDSYIFSYTASDNVTQSAIDLSHMDTLAAQLSNLALAIMSDTLTPTVSYINAAYFSQYYYDYDFIGLYDFCNQLVAYSNSLEVKNIASNIQQTLNYAVLRWGYNGYEVNKSRGLSIYFPYAYYDTYYNNTNFSQDTFWDEMLSYLGL